MTPEHKQIAIEAVRLALAMRPRPSCVTQAQAAEMIGVSRQTVAKMMRAGKLRLNAAGRIPVEDVDALIAGG